MEGVRPASVDDVGRLADLAAEAVEEQREQRGGSVWSVRESRPIPATDSLAADVADPERLVLVGTFEDSIVGYAAVRTERLRDDRLHAVVTDVYVEPAARGVSVGEVLLAACVEWCRERGCAGIDALALPGNRETKNFFERFGFTARALTVHKSLVDP